MTVRFRLDPELAAVNVMIPRFDLFDVAGSRALELLLCEQGRTAIPGVTSTDYTATSPDGNQIAVRIYRPIEETGRLPVLLYFHGGSFMLGGLHTDEERCELYSKHAGCVVVQVDYRLVPEAPFPAAYNDCLAVLRWLVERADELDIDATRIALGGNSAGGNLAAAVALASRAPDLPNPVLQLLINPALDHRGGTASARGFDDSPVFTRDDNIRMWSLYLADLDGKVDERASPSLAVDLHGLAPAAIWISEFDPLRDEAYDYALRLMQADVSVNLQQYAGTIHGFDSYRMTRVGRRGLDDQVLALRSAFIR